MAFIFNALSLQKEIQHLREKLESLGVSPDDQPVYR